MNQVIREAAVAKWGENHAMVEHEINKQTEAYDKLLGYNKDWRPEQKRIIAAAVAKWGENYSMVVYEVEKQTAAKERMK